MKINTFFRMLLCAVALFSFVACSDNDDNDGPLDDGKYVYVGDMVVDQNDGTNFTDSNITVELDFDVDDKTADMLVMQVKFAEAMPIRLNMEVDDIAYTQTGSTLELSGNNIVPEAMGGPFPMYTITNFKGFVKLGESFTFSMVCGEYPVTYSGKAVLTSAK